MPKILSIRMPSALQFTGPGGGVFYGADQEWYAGFWQRQAGCGPTNAASLLWYLARTRRGCAGLAPAEHTKEAMVALMETVWHYVTPGMRGVNRTEIFRDGVLRFAADRGICLAADVLNVPSELGARPDITQTAAFLHNALTQDAPPAFLNLGSGAEKRLQNWHWVVLTAFAPNTLTGWCYDQGERREFDLKLWLKTSPKGGGFVSIHPVR